MTLEERLDQVEERIYRAANRAGRKRFEELRAAGAAHPIEKVGAELRAMMPFISAGRKRVQDVSGG